MPSIRDHLFGRRQASASQPNLEAAMQIAPPLIQVGDGQQRGRFAALRQRLHGAVESVHRNAVAAGQQVVQTGQAVGAAVQQQAQAVGAAAQQQAQAVGASAQNFVRGAADGAQHIGGKMKDAVSKNIVPGAATLSKTVAGIPFAVVAGRLEKGVREREEKAERRFRAENADMIAALSQAPPDSIADRPGVQALLRGDINRNAHGQERISIDEAVQMARMGQHIANALDKGAMLNESGMLPVPVGDQTVEVKPGGFASRALAWHMTAVAANNNVLRLQQNPNSTVNDVTNSGTFVMKDPGGRIYNFLNANPMVEGRVSTHFDDRLNNDNRIFGGSKAVQRGYDDYLGKLPGQGGALLFDRMRDGELFMKVEHAGCPGIFAREEHQTRKEAAMRAPLALAKWAQHTESLIKTSNPYIGVKSWLNTHGIGGGDDEHVAPKVVRQEHIHKGELKVPISDKLDDTLALAEAEGLISSGESERLLKGAKAQGLHQVERVNNYLEGLTANMPEGDGKNMLTGSILELRDNITNVRAELDSLQQVPELQLGGIDRRGNEVHVNLNPDANPASLPGHIAINPPAPNPVIPEQPAGRQVQAVDKLQGGNKGVVFRLTYDDGEQRVVKLQQDSAARAMVGTRIVKDAGVLTPSLRQIGAPGDLQRLEFAATLNAMQSPAARELAGHLRGNQLPVAIEMEWAPGHTLGEAMAMPDFKEKVLMNERFQQGVGRLICADAFAGNPDRMKAIVVPGEGTQHVTGWINAGNLKIAGEGEDLDVIAIDNDFCPGLNLLNGQVLGGNSGAHQVGSLAAANEKLFQEEAGHLIDFMCKQAEVEVSPQEMAQVLAGMEQGRRDAIGLLMERGQGLRAEYQKLGADPQTLDQFAKHRRGMKMLGREEGADGKNMTNKEKLDLAAITSKERQQGYRAFMGKAPKEGDLPEQAQQVQGLSRGRGRQKGR